MTKPVNVEDYRLRARRSLPRFAFDFLDGGAEDEVCVRRNRAALQELALRGSVLADVSQIDTSIELFGQRFSLPIGIAPTGLNGLYWPDGDIALAKAASSAQIPFVLSTASNSRLERVPSEAGGTNWFQLYVMHNRDIAVRLMERAHAAGYGALVLTVDVPVSGNRERDVRNGFRLPLKYSADFLLDVARHPAWIVRLLNGGLPTFVNLAERDDGQASREAQAALLSRALDRSLVWETLGWIRKFWDGPLLIKGVLNPVDARRAVAEGVDGIIVSNHGGRQLDAAQATIEVLPEIVAAAGKTTPVLVDGGFRRGSDVIKALALGARAVLLGRPVLYGLAAAGEQGVRDVLRIFADDIDRTLTLLGVPCLEGLTPERVIRNGIPAQPAADPRAPDRSELGQRTSVPMS